jgi:predicted naringenin-chalcone synthase
MSDEEISDKDLSYKGYYAKLNYDIIKASKQNVAKTIDVILDKHKWSEEDIDDLFKDHEKVLAVYKKSLKELFKDET